MLINNSMADNVLTVLVVVFVATLVLWAASSLSTENKVLQAIKGGEKVLYCHIGDDYKKIDPKKVVRFSDIGWEFTNGYATNCYIR